MGNVNYQQLFNEFRDEFGKMAGQIQILLPKEMSVDIFVRVVLTAVQKKIELLEADRKSFYDACLECAKEGLLPDGKEAALVVYKGKVSLLIMVEGIQRQLYKYANVSKIISHAVYEHDQFDWEQGDNEFIRHKPTLEDRGNFKAVYAIFKMNNGEVFREVLNKSEVDYLKNAGFGAEGAFWKKWYGEMAKKSVIHRLHKRLKGSFDVYGDETSEVTNYKLQGPTTPQSNWVGQNEVPKLVAPQIAPQIPPKETPMQSMEKALNTPPPQPAPQESRTELVATVVDDDPF